MEDDIFLATSLFLSSLTGEHRDDVDTEEDYLNSEDNDTFVQDNSDFQSTTPITTTTLLTPASDTSRSPPSTISDSDHEWTCCTCNYATAAFFAHCDHCLHTRCADFYQVHVAESVSAAENSKGQSGAGEENFVAQTGGYGWLGAEERWREEKGGEEGVSEEELEWRIRFIVGPWVRGELDDEQAEALLQLSV